MTKGMLKSATAIGFAFALMATPAAAQDAFGDWDANADAGIDNQEFATGFGEQGVFDQWDADDSGDLTEDEFGVGYETGGDDFGNRFGEQETAWNEWDADDDDLIDEDEFNDGIFGTYDEDDDDLLGEEEYAAYSDDDSFWDIF